MAYTNIDDPSAYFQTLLWTGNSTDARALTNDGNSDLQPDWVWLKNRDIGYNHFLQDSSRGNTKVLNSDSNTAESTYTNMVESFDTNGFTIGFDGSQVPNFNGNTFVAWQWKANGGSTSTDTSGDINSTVQANQDAGFSIVTYNPSNTTTRNIGHGLGVKPDCIIIRNRTRIENWRVWFNVIGQGALTLDGTATYTVNSNLVNSATSSTFNVGGDFSVNGNYPYVAYCFASKQGYSKFGKYVGNGSTDGPFVYTGFKPALIIRKVTSATGGWLIQDNKRTTFNGSNSTTNGLRPNSNEAEFDFFDIDYLSNGFKIRTTEANHNASGETFIYMAFAEHPFVSSEGVPTTAR